MTNQYVQIVDVELRKGARRDQIGGIVLQLLGIGLILVAVFVSYYSFIAVGILLAAGIYLTQRFYSTAKQFEYDFSTERLVISRTNIVNRRKRILEVVFPDVTSFTYFKDMIMEGDIIATDNARGEDVKTMTFRADGKEFRLLFSPDDYLSELIGDRLRAGDKNVTARGDERG